MGSWVSSVWWGGDPDAALPVSGLSRRDVHLVQKSWAPVYADPVHNGTELLKRLFRAHPPMKDFFRMLKDVPEEKYADNVQFKAHVISLMTSLNLAVENLNQPEVVAAMMRKVGESHNRRSLKEIHFENLKGVIVTMFIEVLGLDEATLGSWGRTVEFWYKHIFPMLEK